MKQTQLWTNKYQALQNYIRREGHSQVPTAHIEKTESGTLPLGDWVAYQRDLKRKGLLSPERERLLAGLPHWEWGPFKRGPKKDQKRITHIKNLRKQGKSLSEIAYEVNLSRQRIHQILKKEGN